jgi:hypothetical protein
MDGWMDGMRFSLTFEKQSSSYPKPSAVPLDLSKPVLSSVYDVDVLWFAWTVWSFWKNELCYAVGGLPLCECECECELIIGGYVRWGGIGCICSTLRVGFHFQ